MNKKNILSFILLLFLSFFIIYYEKFMVFFEVYTGLENPIYSKGNCRIKALENAIDNKSNALFFITSQNEIHAISITDDNIVIDESNAALNKEKEGIKINGLALSEYEKYIKVKLLNVSFDKDMNITTISKDIEYKNDINNIKEYVEYFYQYKIKGFSL